jgi:YD repeat-containing protein
MSLMLNIACNSKISLEADMTLLKTMLLLATFLLPQVAMAEEEITSVEVPGYKQIQQVIITGKRDPFRDSATVSPLDFIYPVQNPFGKSNLGQKNTQKPATENSSKITCDVTTKFPVVIATGEKVQPETDFTPGGALALGLKRTYRSMQPSGVLFGRHWPSDIEGPRLKMGPMQCGRSGCLPANVTLIEEDGTAYLYTLISSSDELATYRSRDAAATGVMIYVFGEEWSVQRGKKGYLFGADALIRSHGDPVTGNRLSYSYVNGRLVDVSNNGGGAVRFEYGTNGLVRKVTDPSGNAWTYGYNGNGMLNRVISPGANPDVREYLYEDSRPQLLTGILINGVRSTRYTYHGSGQVYESGLENGEEKDTLNYLSGTTSIKDVRGQYTEYNFTNVFGEMKLTSVSRAANSTCNGATLEITYDTYGYTKMVSHNVVYEDFAGIGV